MRQVPEYLLIGNGRMARHFAHYLDLLAIPYQRWFRGQPEAILTEYASCIPRILLLINDDAIDAFIREHELSKTAQLIHFSGNLHSPLAAGIHPLMTASQSLFSLDMYQRVPFIMDDSTLSFSDALPGLPNPHYYIDPAFKSLYHSLCVLSGNFTCLLIQKAMQRMQDDMALPNDILHPYLEQLLWNIKNHPQDALTGPLVRNDQQTIQQNINALRNDPYQKIYKAFVNAYEESQ